MAAAATIAEIIKAHDAVGTTELVSGDQPTANHPRPDAQWVRGICPDCKGQVVSNQYYQGGRGYTMVHECWESLGENPTCDYRKVL